MLVGGDTAGNLIYPLILGVCLLAFDQHLDFAQLIVVQVGAGMVGNVAPGPRRHRRHRGRAHGRAHVVRHPAGAGARHRAPLPRRHVPDPALLRVLHPALAARQGLRLGQSAPDARRELRPPPGPPLRLRRTGQPGRARRHARRAGQSGRPVERARVRGRSRPRPGRAVRVGLRARLRDHAGRPPRARDCSGRPRARARGRAARAGRGGVVPTTGCTGEARLAHEGRAHAPRAPEPSLCVRRRRRARAGPQATGPDRARHRDDRRRQHRRGLCGRPDGCVRGDRDRPRDRAGRPRDRVRRPGRAVDARRRALAVGAQAAAHRLPGDDPRGAGRRRRGVRALAS